MPGGDSIGRKIRLFLISPLDDDIVVTFAFPEVMMFFETLKAIGELVDYNKLKDGSWRAEVRGALDVHVHARTLDECRHQLYEAVDARFLGWITGSAKSSPVGRGKRRTN